MDGKPCDLARIAIKRTGDHMSIHDIVLGRR